ncbi:BAR adaptor protein Hob3 [Ciborinia camelliae]|nr:BAR adaptor protein Hob3 [Ciborinia camelliae]
MAGFPMMGELGYGVRAALDALHARDKEMGVILEKAGYSSNSEAENDGEPKYQEDGEEADLQEQNSSGYPSSSSSNFASTPSTSSTNYYPSSPSLYSVATPSGVSSSYLPSTPSLRSGSTPSGSGSQSEDEEWDQFVTMFMAARTEEEKNTVIDQTRRRYRTMEAASLRLQKESKGYLDSLRAMTASQMRIAETIDAFYGDAGAKDGVSRSYKQAVEDLDAETIKALDGPYRTTVLEPISRFCAYFPDINECIKKRNHKLLDYDAMRAKVKKLVEKPDKDVTKLPRAEKETEMAKAAYEQLNDQLFNELPQLIDLRVPYLDPSFEALVKIQLRFCAEAYSRMAQVQQYLDADTREQYAQGHLDSRVEQVLQEIRELSISGTV